ncbi:hypothetical protein PRZ48_015284 [Zasmidium cellare]|uniref:Uncharacterized protein n=1 Tax=Zasmidium cellare TaxID=395010 RepID=A0ABR0DWQ5_ZASCE|nr:hypothetical protein PRZ48_015284 [Zasmidium cellare]
MGHQRRLFAMLNEFLDKSYSFSERAREPRMVVIDDLATKYTSPTEPPCNIARFPLENKTPAQCFQLLEENVRERDSDINTDYFVVFDERSTQDSTVGIVDVDEDEVLTVRVRFEHTAVMLSTFNVANLTVEEAIESANEQSDGVYSLD